ncbi:hypothetical protein ASE14_09245 [Agromyces sp. Root81]|uniref:hypothetical protein n=1 Tax=Agromyces sp. Root81 TaxID=1736601 RepID=UPI0006F33D3B|nr:hypothetical protein [Agromyces sp. Root81]KRC61111.1 hypothetical protein ASE14_09245 [Agromyces sp. Root81]
MSDIVWKAKLLLIPRIFYQLLSPVAAPVIFGLVFYALSWVYPRRIVSLPGSSWRAPRLAWVAIAGALLIFVVACVAAATTPPDTSGVEGGWRRSAPLLAATLVVAVAAIVLRGEPRPAPDSAAIAPRRAWYTFTIQPLLWVSGIIASLLALTALWQTVIATTAPKDGRFLGNVPAYSELPVYMIFNGGYGYIAGVGWPNYLATFIALAAAIAVFVTALRADANRPVATYPFTAQVRTERERTARLFTLLLLGGLIITLGAVWTHAGSIGQMQIAIDDNYISKDRLVAFGGSYDMIAFPLNFGGRLVQGIGAALLLRIATDTARSVSELRIQQSRGATDGVESLAGASH